MVSVLEFSEGNWGHTVFQAHAMGVNAVSWAPAMMPGSLVSSKPELGSRRRFVTGGSDCAVKIWDWRYGKFSFLLITPKLTLTPRSFPPAPHKNPTPTPPPLPATPTGSAMSPSPLLSCKNLTSPPPPRTKPSASGPRHRPPQAKPERSGNARY